nr:hypothetical protein [Bradyrhizobium manausense]
MRTPSKDEGRVHSGKPRQTLLALGEMPFVPHALHQQIRIEGHAMQDGSTFFRVQHFEHEVQRARAIDRLQGASQAKGGLISEYNESTAAVSTLDRASRTEEQTLVTWLGIPRPIASRRTAV